VSLFESQGKFRFQLEFPEGVTVDEDEYVVTGKLKGKKRCVSQILEDLSEELEAAEEVLQNSLIPFLRNMFKRFYDHRFIFSNAVSCVAELDCLCALADVSGGDSALGVGKMCKPEVLPLNAQGPHVLELRQLRHPCVQMVMRDTANKKFIPNDVVLG